MNFREIPYVRPDIQAVKSEMTKITEELKTASSYSEAKSAFIKWETLQKKVESAATLSTVRHSIDTRDEFYDKEEAFWNEISPELQEYNQAYTSALLDSKFRSEFENEFGKIMFLNAEIELKTFSPEIIPELQKENELTSEYEKFLATAKVPFEGKEYTLAQMSPFKNDADDARRLAAWKAEGKWYKDNQDKLDEIYDKLTHLRDEIGRKLGYKDYTQLGYYRMGRNCYSKDDVEKFRECVRKYLVPVADSIYKAQAKRLGKEYPMNFADNALMFRSGNPRPCGNAEEILSHAKKFYDELSPETSVFFRTMLDCELLDVLAKEGKRGGGYCTLIAEQGLPFIFANFNGTKDDVETVTHEAGHAFACWLNKDRLPMSTIWPGLEGCEVHSMSMEFFAWPWSEGFFRKDTKKFYYSHLAGALNFIPYGTLVDHFQHIVYERPDMTPAERHGVWRELLGVYMPWVRLDGEIPFYGDGEGWQRQQHIYSRPFYYIDYCLAQTVALQFWTMLQNDLSDAWQHYMSYTSQGGSKVFTELLSSAGLRSPFDENCLKGVCDTAKKWLDSFDLGEIV